MATISTFADLGPSTVKALKLHANNTHGSSAILVEEDRCAVDWSPKTYHHHSSLLPLLLMMHAIDVSAASARWQTVSLVEAISCVTKLDGPQKSAILALAASDGQTNFSDELLAWIDRFDLARGIVTLDRRMFASGDRRAYYTVRPIRPLFQMAAVLKPLTPARRLAAVAVFALYNGSDSLSAYKGKRLTATLNPPAIDGFEAIREEAGDDAHIHLLRLIATYCGW